MSNLSVRHIPVFALLLSGGLLCGAWYFEYVLGYAPCQMCYWQRHMHKLVLFVAVLLIGLTFAKQRNDRIGAVLLGLALLGSFAMAFWHVGVEFERWPGPQSCAVTGGPSPDYTDMTLEQINAEMAKAKPPSCSEAVWHFLGLSMAGWNALISLLGALICFGFAGKARSDV